MKSVLVIGLGNFGMLIVKQIHELGQTDPDGFRWFSGVFPDKSEED